MGIHQSCDGYVHVTSGRRTGECLLKMVITVGFMTPATLKNRLQLLLQILKFYKVLNGALPDSFS